MTTGAPNGIPGGLPTISDSSSEDDGDYGEEAVDVDPPSDKRTPEDPWDNSLSVFGLSLLPLN